MPLDIELVKKNKYCRLKEKRFQKKYQKQKKNMKNKIKSRKGGKK